MASTGILAAAPIGASPLHPESPRTLADTRLPFLFVVELAAKILLRGGAMRLAELSDRACLSRGALEPVLAFLRKERLIEVFARTATDTELAYGLTDLGRDRAEAFARKCAYAGPAPVALPEYLEVVARQSVRDVRIGRADMERAFAGVVIDDLLLDRLGAALGAGRGMVLFGPSGAGKSFVASRLGAALPGDVLVPHAVEVDGEVIVVLDPSVHRSVESAGCAVQTLQADRRWVRVVRPVVIAGGELMPAMLDLERDAATGCHIAPPQMKAAGGVLVIDDLGRHRVPAAALLNRLCVPLERGLDHLVLSTGKSITLPFDAIPVFVAGASPASLGDAAVVRRLGYKIPLDALPEGQYRELFEQACERSGIASSAAALDRLVLRHRREGRPLLASVPAEIVGRVRDYARYRGAVPQIEPALVDWAWASEFGEDTATCARAGDPA